MFVHVADLDLGDCPMAVIMEPKNVLIIEDVVEARNFVSRVLELEGHQVFQAESGNEGMKIIRAVPLDIVLLDLRLPGRGGWSVLAEVKRDSALSMVPVVVLTASAEALQREKALAMGVASYLVKPLSASRLRCVVAEILQGEEQCRDVAKKSSGARS